MERKVSLNKAIWRNLSSGVAVLVSFSWSKFPFPYKGERYLCTYMQEKRTEKQQVYTGAMYFMHVHMRTSFA